MKRFHRMVLIVVLCLPAQVRGQQGGEKPEAALAVRVVSVEQRGLPGARLNLFLKNADLPRIGNTGVDGTYRFGEVPPGEHRLRISKSNHRAKSVLVNVPDARANVSSDVRLLRLAALAGELMDAEGRPVAGATVRALLRSYAEGQAAWVKPPGIAEDRTDDRGRYRLHGLVAGDYVVVASPKEGPAIEGLKELLQAPMFYPNTADLGQAGVVSLAWGAVRDGTNVRLAPAAGTLATIHARDLLTQAVCSRCNVEVYSGRGRQHILITRGLLDRAGWLSIVGLPSGAYTVVVTRYDREPLYGREEFAIVPDRATSAFVPMWGETKAAGTVRLEDPKTLPGKDEPISLRLDWLASDPTAPLPGDRGPGPIALDKENVEFSLAVLPGSYRMDVELLPAGFFVREIRVNGRLAPGYVVSLLPVRQN